jgi:SAM-dependent methyltransferase
VEYFARCTALGFVKAPFLEIGSAKVQGDSPNLCDIAADSGVQSVTGVDLEGGKGVDLVADFAVPPGEFASAWCGGTFATVAVFNVLEHTFDPLTVLQNALSCVAPNGTLLALTPTVWPIHNYPRDYNRLLPDWYCEFAKRHDLMLHDNAFCWISQFGIWPVRAGREANDYVLPTFQTVGGRVPPWKVWKSRVVHRIFNTFGRSHGFTHVALAAVFSRLLANGSASSSRT